MYHTTCYCDAPYHGNGPDQSLCYNTSDAWYGFDTFAIPTDLPTYSPTRILLPVCPDCAATCSRFRIRRIGDYRIDVPSFSKSTVTEADTGEVIATFTGDGHIGHAEIFLTALATDQTTV